MILSKARVAAPAPADKAKPERKVPELEEFLAKRDYMGAITLLQVRHTPSLPLPTAAASCISAPHVVRCLGLLVCTLRSLGCAVHIMVPRHLLRSYSNHDAAGITVLSFHTAQYKKRNNKRDVHTLEWLAYCHFHYGEHDKALAIYQNLLNQEDPDPLYFIYGAACNYYMGLYKEAEALAVQGPRWG